ncbi:hypothetical protein ZHAS_00017655 [Anopheles sinensis]|uniref:Uncharacterized protein n=1 Tax=Anopheles sinensis TaxID=74873 RepID=A0A084WGX7_ANOSI|nr:hypothetical protein ZHAS_00017655 [Anopheles sinensis]
MKFPLSRCGTPTATRLSEAAAVHHRPTVCFFLCSYRMQQQWRTSSSSKSRRLSCSSSSTGSLQESEATAST